MALFPFLAVLMCAMGALALLLVVVNRQSRVQAIRAAQAEVAALAADDAELESQRELVAWRIGQLQQSREKTESQLGEARLMLGHLEDHSRRLRRQVEGLQASLDALRQPASAATDSADLELENLRAQIATAQDALQKSRQAAGARPRSYAVIPYDGPNPSRRRPVYLECRADAVVLQPEGIVLTARDFEGPLGPGNPLDVAMRAVREYVHRAGGDDAAGEPYPLLLIRPDGVEAYYAARSALLSWGGEFGYELIGEDWKLKFPRADAQLGSAIDEVVQSARQRQTRLAAAAPRHYGGTQGAKYRAAPFRGGIVREDDGGEGGGLQSRSTSGRFGQRYHPPGGSAAASNDARPSPNASPGLSMATDGTGQTGSATPGPSLNPPGQATSDSPAAPSNPSAPGARVVLPENFVAGRPAREADSASHPRPDAAATALRPGEWIERPPAQSKPLPKPAEKKSSTRPLADTRGRDWGLPNAARGSVAVTRPLRIDCYPDRLVVAPGDRSGDRIVRLGPRTEESVDGLVSAIWEYMDSWGIAGRGMYWRPVLHLHVFPGGEDRSEDLRTLLEGSGMECKAK